MRLRRTFATASRFQTVRAKNSAAASPIQTTRTIGTFAVVLFITALQAHARQASRRLAVNWTTINIRGGYINRTRINIVQYHTDHTYQTYTINIRQYTSNHDIIAVYNQDESKIVMLCFCVTFYSLPYVNVINYSSYRYYYLVIRKIYINYSVTETLLQNQSYNQPMPVHTQAIGRCHVSDIDGTVN